MKSLKPLQILGLQGIHKTQTHFYTQPLTDENEGEEGKEEDPEEESSRS